MKKKFFIVTLIIPLVLLGANVGRVRADPHDMFFIRDTHMLLINGDENSDAEFLRTRIQLDDEFAMYIWNYGDGIMPDLTNVHILIINDAILNATENQIVVDFVQAGNELFYICGDKTSTDATLLDELGVIKNANPEASSQIKLLSNEMANSTLNEKLEWSSAPEIKNYTRIDKVNGGEADSDYPYEVIVHTEDITGDISQTGGNSDPLILKYDVSGSDVFVMTIWLENETWNNNFQLWPVYNYAWFVFLSSAIGTPVADIPSYGEWENSPVPHLKEQIILGGVMVLAVVTMTWFYFNRKKKSRKTTLAEDIGQLPVEAPESVNGKDKGKKKGDEWENIGPHRQISGFLFSLFASLLVVLPQMIVTTIVMPQFVQPYPQVAGWFSWTRNFFQAIWILFDVGTSLAMVKYFAEYRVKQPEKAVHYVQIFVWWQMISGTVQITMFAFAGSLIYPSTNVAHMSWIFILHSLIQFPGWFLVFMFLFQSMQRTDLYALMQVLQVAFYPLIGQIIFILIFKQWGANNPIFGNAMGAGFGYAIGSYFGEWCMFATGLGIFKKLGYHPKTVFRVDFNKEEFKEALKYGVKLTIGSIWPPLIWLLQMQLVARWILNWSAEQGYFDLVWNFMLLVNLVSLYFSGAIGGISEAHSHKKFKLTSLYISESFKWGNYFLFFLISMLAAVGEKIIIGASGPAWERAAVFIIPMLIFQLFGPISWLGDAVLEGTGRTDLAAIAWIMEQVTRAVALVIFVSPNIMNLGMIGVIYAYIPSLVAKDLFLLIVIYKKVSKFKFYWYMNFIAPFLGAVLNYIMQFYFGEFLWSIGLGGIAGAAILFLVGMFGFMYIFGFFVGFLGGWDDNLLAEFHRSVQMIKGVKFLAAGLYKTTEWGCKISPLHNKFKMTIWEEGIQEGIELTEEKLVLNI